MAYSIKKSSREDGEETKEKLIECAGRLIAAQGYDRTTSKEICRLAGVNLASVNYHFGSREGLYRAVLENVCEHIMPLPTILGVVKAPITAREKLMKFMDMYVEEAFFSDSWQIQVSIREMVNPSTIFMEYADHTIREKLTPVLSVLAEYMGLPSEDRRVSQCFLAAISPFLIFLLSSHHQLGHLFYGISGKEEKKLREETDMIETFVMAGVGRMVEEWKKE
jgi:AcrR family transcriptional regulator